MKFVEIYKLNNDGTQNILATCQLGSNNEVIIDGDSEFVEYLKIEGIFDYSKDDRNKIYFNDGIKFLEQLKYNFKSGYFNASGIKEK